MSGMLSDDFKSQFSYLTERGCSHPGCNPLWHVLSRLTAEAKTHLCLAGNTVHSYSCAQSLSQHTALGQIHAGMPIEREHCLGAGRDGAQNGLRRF